MSISPISSTPSVGHMPPRHGKKLAEAMDEAFRTNSKPVDDGEDEKSERAQEDIPEQEPVIQQPQGYTMSSVYPPQPCERCVRSKKICKGIAGARCEHCKSLHQKCSNSTGPPRGRHAAGRRDSAIQILENGAPGTQGRPKRKVAIKQNKPEDEEYEEEEGVDERPSQVQKKRRTGIEPGPRRARLLKDAVELEGAIKRLQSSFVKDIARLQQLAGSLASEIRAMDDE